MFQKNLILHRAAIALAAACTLPLPLRAQETIDHASLTGRVTDASGAIIRNATINARALSTNAISQATTDAAGRFRFGYLQVGRYEVITHQSGFNDARTTLTLTLGGAFDLPITLVPGATETVTVDSASPTLETNRSEVAATIQQEEVANLPFNGRNFLDLALLAPGVSPTNTAANQLFAETSAVAGQGISVNSQRNFSNSFIVDGLSANDDAAGLVQSSIGLDAIREMQVVTSGGQAEFGRALGGYVSFVTKSGGNQLHGDAYSYLRDKNLNAQNPLAQALLPYTQVQSGASLGGHLRKDRTFFFTNFEQRQLNQTGIITITPANAAAIDAVLKSTSYPGPMLNVNPAAPTTIYPNPVRASQFFTKLDQRVSARDQASLRYSLYHVSSVNSRGVGGTSYTSAGAGLRDLDQTVALSNILTLTPKTLSETRAQFTNSNLQAPVNDAAGPAVSISGVASFGTLSGSPTGRYDRLYEVAENISHQAAAHALRAGADFLYNDLTITFPQSNRGAYVFSSLANFQAGKYSTFTQSFGSPLVPQQNPNIGLYAQDEWKATPRLTVNVGLRYDLQFLQTVYTDTNNISPRLGLAYSPHPGTVVRASVGLFYDRIPLRALSNALQSDGNRTILDASTFTTLALSYGQAGAPTFPNIDSGYTAITIPANLRVGLSTMDPHMQNAYSLQASAEVEQQLTPTSTLALSYQHVRGEHLLLFINLNAPACYAAQPATGPRYPAVDPINLCRPNPAYANNKQYSSAADSYYDGLSVSYVQRPTTWGSYRVSYTWSKAIDDVSEFFFSSPVNNFNLREDRSFSDDDQRHRVVFDATAHTSLQPARTWQEKLAHGFLLSGILQYYSPFPFNIITGQNSLQTTPLRPCLPGFVLTPNAPNTCANALPGTMIGRNAGRGFSNFTMSARLSRTIPLGERFHLQGIVETFNALNHRNNQIPNGTFGSGTYPASPSPTFGQPTAVGDPRSIQLALRLSF